jgi:hypothetical protein
MVQSAAQPAAGRSDLVSWPDWKARSFSIKKNPARRSGRVRFEARFARVRSVPPGRADNNRRWRSSCALVLGSLYHSYLSRALTRQVPDKLLLDRREG